MIESPDFNDPAHGVPIFSLYGDVRRPTDAMMDAFDVLLVDLQDLGCRIYTFITTLRYVLEAASQHRKSVAGEQAIFDAKISPDDVVIGVAASGTTPFTVGVLRAATAAGAVTIALANNAGAPLFQVARHRIWVETGSEVIAGSTRMKAGTAQKIVLNLFSTALMVKMGRVYRGLMVDMRARNAKLRRRAATIVSEITRCSESDAARHVEQADGDVKTAVLLALGLGPDEAAELLRRHSGNLRAASRAFKGRDD